MGKLPTGSLMGGGLPPDGHEQVQIGGGLPPEPQRELASLIASGVDELVIPIRKREPISIVW
jgi:hypothetical protein